MAYRFAAALAAMGLLAMPAAAQERPAPCGDRGDLVSQLKDKYHESQTGFGMTGNGSVVELLTSDNGSWTLVLTFPNGRSCMMAAGEGWDMKKAKLAGKDA